MRHIVRALATISPGRRASPIRGATSTTESVSSLPRAMGAETRQMLAVLLDELLGCAQLDLRRTAALPTPRAQREAHRCPKNSHGNDLQLVASHGAALTTKAAGTPLGHRHVRHRPSRRPPDAGIATFLRRRPQHPRARAYANRGHLCLCVSMCVDATRPSVPDGSDRVS